MEGETPTIADDPSVIIAHVPVAFTKLDYSNSVGWPMLRQALLDNARESLGMVMDAEIKRRGW